jgi:hypothetical protein
MTFATTPSIVITSSNSPAYPGTSCNLVFYVFNEDTNSAAWTNISTSPVSPSGTTLSFPAYTIDTDGSIVLSQGVHQYPGFECQ